MWLQPMLCPDPPHEDGLIATALAIAVAVQWVARCGGAWLVSATTRSTVSVGSGGMREGRDLSRVSPSIPSCIKRSCQRGLALADGAHDCGGALAIRREQNTPGAPDMLLRAVAVPDHRLQASPVRPTSMLIPLRMPHNGTN